MKREQMLAVLHGARLALPHLSDRSAAERWSAVVAEIDSHLSSGDVAGARAAAGLAGRRIEIDERFGDRSARPADRSHAPEDAVAVGSEDAVAVGSEDAVAVGSGDAVAVGSEDPAARPGDRPVRSEQEVLVARVLKHTFRAIADADWEQAARAEESLRQLSPDLGYEISVAGRDLVGRWLVEPAEGRVGVAATRSGKVVVARDGRLDEYDDLAAAAKDLPADVVRQAADRLVREFNRRAWIAREAGYPQDRHNFPETVASDGR
jgi:hypothetical protein